eukprot:m.183857 g.183857  ORF g.183857 m.183857 type:complete len:401 (-) comp53510_c0_seq3:649-1851(-)
MRWVAVGLLVPVAMLNYLDRQMMATMRGSMMDDLPDVLTRARWGLALAVFKWIYAALSPLAGILADSLDRRRLLAASLFVWSLTTWLTGQIESFRGLLATRAIMGVSEALYMPSALSLIADLHEQNTRSRAIGLHQSGIHIGVLLGGFTGYLGDPNVLGWRRVFSMCGAFGALYAGPLFLALRDPFRPRTSSEAASISPRAALSLLGANNQFWRMVVYFTLPALSAWVVRDWMPDILREKFELDQGQAGVSAVLFVQLATLAGVGIGGFGADWCMSRHTRGRIFVSALGVALFLPTLVGLSAAGSLTLATTYLILFGLGLGFYDTNNMPILCQLVEPELRATAFGIMNLVSISGGGLADWTFGLMRDADISLHAVFLLYAAVTVLAIVIIFSVTPRAIAG